MTTNVTRVQGTYNIQTVDGVNVFVVDTTGTDYIVPTIPTTSKVVITGDLYVVGTRTQTSSTNVTIKDPTILLNQGDILIGGAMSSGQAGIQISRGSNDGASTSAFLQWDDTVQWQGTGAVSNPRGIWQFRLGPKTGSTPLYSAIKINAIRIPYENGTEGPFNTVNGGPRLNVFGSDNPNAVISVSGTNNYAANVTDNDDIPNKKYVDDKVIATTTSSQSVVVGRSYIAINDSSVDGGASEIFGVLDGAPVDKVDPITSGTVVLRISKTVAQFAGLSFINNQIKPVLTNTNLVLTTDGLGQIVLAAPLVFQSSNIPVPGIGQTGLYTDDPGAGGTGVYYVTSSTGGVITQDEFVSRKKALIYSLIF